MTPPILGIDLGTTNSLGGVLQAGVPTLFPSPTGSTLTPSVVALDDDGVLLVGEAALARRVTHPELTAAAFKRDMGTQRTYALGSRTFRPQELSAAVLASLKQDAEKALGLELTEAVITVPAYFGDLQRQATRDAGAIAGLKVERIINEPTAAAMAYGMHERDAELRAVVLDLGGGTFDVTVLEIMEGVIEIQSSAGDARLGGEDFTEALVAVVAPTIERSHATGLPPTGPSWARLIAGCEQVKRRLTSEPSARLVLPALALVGKTVDIELELTREQALTAWGPLLERIRRPIARALNDARVDANEVDEVLIVGGATRMPCFVELAARLFEKMPHRGLPPDETVAHGATIQAALKGNAREVEDLVVTDVAPFTMGVEVCQERGGTLVEGLYSPIIERGTVIPTSRVERYHPVHPRQREVILEIYQGEHSTTRKNTHLGKLRVPLGLFGDKRELGFEVRFSYDLNGLLEVEVTVERTGKMHSCVIENRPGTMTKSQVAEARKDMARLKFHPRDSLPNRTALARAEALHVELTGPERVLLRQAIHELEAALASQDPRVIDPVREELNAVIAHLGG